MRGATNGIAAVVLLSVTGAFAADIPLATTELRVRNRPGPQDANARKIAWSAQDAAVMSGPQGSARDPRCIPFGGGTGGTIRIFSDRSAGSVEDTGDIFLPCANWRAVGRDTNPTGFVYVDADQSEGPCRRIAVTSGKGVKASCTGTRTPLAYDLQAGVDQGSVAVLLRVGATDRYCTSVDAANGHDGSDGRLFRGRRAPAPASCPVPFVCGDRILVAGEMCDDGNVAIGDGCSAACQIEDGYACTGQPSVCALICSDGMLDPGETCDDGNLTPGDGCDDDCQIENGYACAGEPSVCALVCSDGTLDPGETCDDGNLTVGDGCDATCATEAHYSCVGEPSACTTPCGDGLIVGSEACDDGGAAPADGCSDACAIEPGFACAGEPSVCTAGCGDSIVGGSEECDDGNSAAADGCDPHCTYEPLCLVTRDGGDPSHASIVRITRDGAITPMGGVTLPGNDPAFGRQTLARCGQRIYFNLGEAIAGLEVGADGALTHLPSFTLTEPGQIDQIDEIACSPVQDLVITLESASLIFGQATSYRVDAGTGALTQAGRVTTAGTVFTRYYSDFHPITHELYYAAMFNPPLGSSPDQTHLGRIAYDAVGNLTLAQQMTTQPFIFATTTIDGIAFTRDASELALFAFFDGTQTCFGQFDAPGTQIPPMTALAKTCGSATVPVNDRWFAPRPEGGPIVYFVAGSTLYTGMFDPPTIDVVSSLPGLTGGRLLLGFDGRVIVLLDAANGTVRTFDVASDLVTVTPNDVEPIGATPFDGVLLPCPGL